MYRRLMLALACLASLAVSLFGFAPTSALASDPAPREEPEKFIFREDGDGWYEEGHPGFLRMGSNVLGGGVGWVFWGDTPDSSRISVATPLDHDLKVGTLLEETSGGEFGGSSYLRSGQTVSEAMKTSHRWYPQYEELVIQLLAAGEQIDLTEIEVYFNGLGWVTWWSWIPTRIEDASPPAPSAAFALYQNGPNPFNPSTTIRYELASPGRVNLGVFDANGWVIRTLVDENQLAGSHAVQWDGTSDAGVPLPSGVYFYRLETAGQSKTRPMMMVK